MHASSRDRDRAHLERSLESEQGHALLRKLKRRASEAAAFDSWSSLTAFMQTGVADDPHKDAILRAIATCSKEDQHPLWHAALLACFWPALLKQFGQRRRWDDDADELWQTIVTEFLVGVDRLDVERRPERIAAKLVGDCWKRVHRQYEPCWRWQERHAGTEPEILAEAKDERPGVNFAAIELREAQEQRAAEFRRAFEAGVVGEDDLFLIIATDVFGQSVADVARARGVAYQTLKKRRQRALAAIREWQGTSS